MVGKIRKNPTTEDDQVDCLVCHEQTGKYRKFPYGYAIMRLKSGRIIRKPDFVAVARSVGKPSRRNCGVCHFNGGGADGAKHGDLDSSLLNPPESLDVHMAPDGLDFGCTTCHAGMGHRISGSRYRMKAKDAVGIDRPGHTDFSRTSCESCHGLRPHPHQPKLNDHTKRVACQSCHIPSIARGGVDTKTFWDWRTAGRERNSEDLLAPEENPPQRITHTRHHGTITWGKHLVPAYHWFNGRTDFTLITDKIDPKQPVSINTISGGPNDPKARIWPFKVMRVQMPYDPVNNNLVVNHAVPSSPTDQEAFDRSYDWKRAVRAGMKDQPIPYSGKVGFVQGRMFMPITHMVAPKNQALTCEACHHPSGRLAGVSGIYLPGRDRFPLLKQIWTLMAVLVLCGILAHVLFRFFFSRTSAAPDQPALATHWVTMFSRYERFSHWGQALLILGLMATGFEVAGHYTWNGYADASRWHRYFAWSLVLFWTFSVFWLMVTGGWRQYVPTTEKLRAMLGYYLHGMFYPERYHHPFRKSRRLKHNPLQRFSYFILSLIISPLVWLSGLFYVYAGRLDELGVPGLTLERVASLHLSMAYLLSIFLLIHLYMAFIGKPLTSHLRGIITGKVAMPDDALVQSGGYQVLMVEDDADFALLVRQWLCGTRQNAIRHLSTEGLTLTQAGNIKQARHRLRGDNFDLILLDLGLPESDGLDTFLAVQKVAQDIPIVVLTSMEQEEMATQAIHLGAQDVLRKGEMDGVKLARAIRYAQHRHQVGSRESHTLYKRGKHDE
ncbi:MAG: tetrathionate reductase family octaheme c-type cytochrome [Magnetococcales bacterium]|nr:tetrathionate reductase family octaheme c-type cytochrome [Magnetococcales bacterium]